MRYVNGFLSVLFLAFAAVQYNDPDAPVWILIYLAPAAWAATAALRPSALRSFAAVAGLAATLAVEAVLTAWLWPQDAGWWRREVWWDSEAAREGMGLMLATFALAVVALTAWSERRRPAGG